MDRLDFPISKLRTSLTEYVGQVEVRFFGGYHRKALVERHHIKPISTNVHSLHIKQTSEWNKAIEELKRYQELHDKYKDKPEFLTDQYGDPFDGEKVCWDIQISFDKNTLGFPNYHQDRTQMVIWIYF